MEVEGLLSRRGVVYLVILFLISSYLMFFKLGASSLKGGEANHAVVSKHVADTGQLYPLYMNSMDPRTRPQYYCMKPPLKIWAEALAFRLFSYNEFSARVVDAIFGVLTIILVYAMVVLIFGEPTLGFLASMLTLAFPPIIISHCFRHGNQDSALVFFYTASILFYLYYRKSGSLLSFCLSIVSMVLGLLVKDVFLLFFGFSVLLGEVIIFRRNPKSLLNARYISFIAIPFFSYAAFKIYSGIATHGVCLSRFFKPPFILSLGEHKPRYIKGFMYYFKILFKLYGVFLLLTSLSLLKKYIFSRDKGEDEFDWKLALFTLFISLLYILAISIPVYKVKRYIYPAIPGLAVSMAFFIWTFIRSVKDTWAKALLVIVVAFFILIPLRYENAKIIKVKVNPYHTLMRHYNTFEGEKAFIVDLTRSGIFGTYATFYFSRLSTPVKWYQEPELLSFLSGFRGRAFIVVSQPEYLLGLLRSKGYSLVKIWPLKHRKKQVPRNFVLELSLPGAKGEGA